MKKSAGTLLYREGPAGLEVLLVHPSGNYNRNKPWSIPKGEPEPGEDDLAAVARRETLEEAGVVADELVALGSIQYTKSKKTVYAFAGPAPADAAPRCASWEVDQARSSSICSARGSPCVFASGAGGISRPVVGEFENRTISRSGFSVRVAPRER